jgi:HlyD family secretion protein
MANPYADLHALSVRRPSTGNGVVLRPPRRWFTRVVLPLVLLAGFGGLMAWASWDLLRPSTPVTVTPVVARKGIVQATGIELFSATGWIEPGPTAIDVPALAEGVVEHLLVLPGQRVEANQPIAKLVDTQARLALQAAQEDTAERRLKVRTAQADLAEAEASLKGADTMARANEELFAKNVISKPVLEQSLAQRDVAAAKVDQAKARVQEAEARIKQGVTLEKMAELHLERMTVRSPVAGVVMSLNAVPGHMVGGRPAGPTQPSGVVTLYDPGRIQVRVEVQVDKFQLVRPGQPAAVEVDVLPGQRLPGTVLYDTHETNLERNTVRVKVGLRRDNDLALAAGLLPGSPFEGLLHALGTAQSGPLSPHQTLRPGMIAKVRVLSPPTESKETGGEVLRLFVPKRLVISEGKEARLWIVDQAKGRAMLVTVVLGQGTQGDLVEVAQGLQPSDKLIASGRETLQPGQRIRIAGEE